MNPTGRQFEIAAGDKRAVVVELGGGLRSYEAGGQAVVDGYGADEMAPAGRGQLLLPWPNRIEDGTYEFGGSTEQLALSEPARGNAIHGLVRYVAWTAHHHDADRVVMTCRLYPRPGYPFLLDLHATYRVDEDGLTVTLGADNIGRRAAPFGAGAHPYVRVGDGPIDTARLTAPAAAYYEADARAIPVRRQSVDGTVYDFRAGKLIGATELDTAFTDLERDGEGRATVSLSDEAAGTTVQLWMGPAFTDLMLYSDGDRRRSLAVEPMTCPPNAFRTGERLIVLEPGEHWEGGWGIRS